MKRIKSSNLSQEKYKSKNKRLMPNIALFIPLKHEETGTESPTVASVCLAGCKSYNSMALIRSIPTKARTCMSSTLSD